MSKSFWLSLGAAILLLGGIAVLIVSQQLANPGEAAGVIEEVEGATAPGKDGVPGGNDAAKPEKELTAEEKLVLAAEGVGLGEVIMAEDESVGPGVPIQWKYELYPTTNTYFVVESKTLALREGPDENMPVSSRLQRNDRVNYLETVTVKALSTDGTGYDVTVKTEDQPAQEAPEQPAASPGDSAESESLAASRESAVPEEPAGPEEPAAPDESSVQEEPVQKWAPERWYHVMWDVNGKTRYGFVKEGQISKRVFQFDKMESAIKTLDAYTIQGRVTYIDNYRNRMGRAPLWNGQTEDDRGTERSQSAPGYFDPANQESFVYLQDGTLVQMLTASGDYIKVKVLHSEEVFYVPKKYIPAYQSLNRLTRVVIVDRANQNEGVYEKMDGNWVLVSKTLSTTGAVGPYKQPTPLGYYYVIEKRSQFLYYKDGTNEFEGYAPYTIRFCGGAYIHGVPVGYIVRDGTKITPGHREYSKTIGTVPLSHKCVRNYTSHAKFLYNWYVPHETAVIVIE